MYGLSTILTPCNEYLCSKAAMRVMDSIIKDIEMCIDFYLTRCNGGASEQNIPYRRRFSDEGIEEYFEENPQVALYKINVAKLAA